MEFVWNDGGRAACGFVGLAGDCVPRAISIATGLVYRDVYQKLAEASETSPRNGVRIDVSAEYLLEMKWKPTKLLGTAADWELLPRGNVILHLRKEGRSSSHYCAVIDRVVHDTWNPSDDVDYRIQTYWTHPDFGPESEPQNRIRSDTSLHPEDMTQEEFDKILNRLRALDRTAQNGGSTEAEKHNAIRMMQALMLRHNLSRDDISAKDNTDSVQFTRIACPVNGSRACSWEKALANFVTMHVLPTTQWFSSKKGHRTLFWFYGPIVDVRNALSLFRELLVTIAAAAKLQFGGYARGSGASYAEGYVRGLPKPTRNGDLTAPSADSNPNYSVNPSGDPVVLADTPNHSLLKTTSSESLIQLRTIAIQRAAVQWLKMECDISLVTLSGSGRYAHDDQAERTGRLHGSQHDISIPDAPKRLH